MEWTEHKSRRAPTTKYSKILAKVREDQPRNPGLWAVIGEYRTRQTGYNLVSRLKKRWPAFQFKSEWDGYEGKQYVLARYIGVEADDE
jgi:hypothetical protein